MADDIEVTVVLTDEEFRAYRKVTETHHESFLDAVKAELLDLLLIQLEEPLERGAYPEAEPEEDDTCPSCIGTGIPQLGPPDVGFCSACRGTGVKKVEQNDFDPPIF